MQLNDYNYVEDQEQIDALEEFAPKVRGILRGYRKKRQLSAIATRLGFHAARLAEMINKDSNTATTKDESAPIIWPSLLKVAS